MAIGSSKIGVLGGKPLTPGGSQTFNSPGTFTVPKGISKVTITGFGSAGNPGGSGNPGAGGAGAGGGGAGGIFLGGCYLVGGPSGGNGGRTGCPCGKVGGVGGGAGIKGGSGPAGPSGYEKGIDAEIINIHTIKPLDAEAIVASIKKTGCAVTAEEHNVLGGLGDSIAQVAAKEFPIPIEMIGTQDTFGESGKPTELLKKYGLDTEFIVAAAEKAIGRKK